MYFIDDIVKRVIYHLMENELMRIATALLKFGLEIEHWRTIKQEFFRPNQLLDPDKEVSP